jgi:hypothetical protein
MDNIYATQHFALPVSLQRIKKTKAGGVSLVAQGFDGIKL